MTDLELADLLETLKSCRVRTLAQKDAVIDRGELPADHIALERADRVLVTALDAVQALLREPSR